MCGIVGVYNINHASRLAFELLKFLQHRAHETAGIASTDGDKLYIHKDQGLAKMVFDHETIDNLVGDIAIGHLRYSTTGKDLLKNAQPFGDEQISGQILALGHNGNFTNYRKIRIELEKDGASFRSTSDSELPIHLMRRSKKETIEDKIAEAVKDLEGTYSLVIMTNDILLGVRDPYGNRPLWLGTVDSGYVLASENCGEINIRNKLRKNINFVREIEPGEIVSISEKGIESSFIDKKPDRLLQCIFELLYYARPESIIFGKRVAKVRRWLGGQLYYEINENKDWDIDSVVPVMDSGLHAAVGYSRASGVDLNPALVRSHYTGRTFINPEKKIIKESVLEKLSPIPSDVEGQNVLVIDDTIVRSNTIKVIIKLLKDAGANKVYVGIPAPPIIDCCYHGVNIEDRAELIASAQGMPEIQKEIGADGLHYLSFNGMLDATGMSYNDVCTCCFTAKQYFDVE